MVGFNSLNYDLSVIKPYFFQRVASLAVQTDKQAGHDITDLEKEKDEEEEREKKDKSKLKFVVKDMNQYKCASKDILKFLDAVSFIVPGFSYSKYLAAFDVKEQNGFFPHQFVTHLGKNWTCLTFHTKKHSSVH